MNKILYEDEYLLIIFKKKKILIHPIKKKYLSIISLLLKSCTYNLWKFSSRRISIIHRLDFGTSGIVLGIKKNIYLKYLINQFISNTPIRIYLSLSYNNFLKLNQKNQFKKMKTKIYINFKIKKPSNNILFSLLNCILVTGKKNQIRILLNNNFNTIVGENVYKKFFYFNLPICSDIINKLNYQCLCSYILGFNHPITLKLILIEYKIDIYLRLVLISILKVSMIIIG